MNKFINTLCNICSSVDVNSEERLYPIRSGHLVRCRKCDLYYVNPRRDDLIQAILTDDTPVERCEAKKLNYWGRIVEFNMYLKEIQEIKQSPGRLLDIGCYEGYFLYEARKYGWECCGVEPHRGGRSMEMNG